MRIFHNSYYSENTACLLRFFQAFAENLFSLFDIDGSGSVSLQELMGGLGRLLR